MVEILSSSCNFTLALCKSRASVVLLPLSAASAFAFGSCKEGWLLHKQKKNQNTKGNRFLISITVLGSTGPIRFVVSEEELVAVVIDMSLTSYAREGRLPVLGSDFNDFFLYCPGIGSDALSPLETIGSKGFRNFMLYRKPLTEKVANAGESPAGIVRKGSGSWKAWLNKSLNLKIPSH